MQFNFYVLGNLDDKVDERVLYEIMVQAGPLIDVYLPRDKETKRHKGYGFAEYTSEISAQYAVSLFSGLVFLQKKLLRFSVGANRIFFNTLFTFHLEIDSTEKYRRFHCFFHIYQNIYKFFKQNTLVTTLLMRESKTSSYVYLDP